MSPDPKAVATMTVSQARGWKPETLGLHGIAWQLASQKIMHELTPVTTAAADSGSYWVGGSGDAARGSVAAIHTKAATIATALDTAATTATTGSLDISAHRQTVVKHVDDAIANTYDVADDGTVSASKKMYTTLVARVGVTLAHKAWARLVADAADRTATVQQALADLLAADLRAESAIRHAFDNEVFATSDPTKWATPIGEVPPADASVETNRHWWNTLTEAQQKQLIDTYPDLIGNRDGIPIEARDEANRSRLEGLIPLAERELQTVAAQFGTDSDQYKAATAKLEDLKAVEKAIAKPDHPPQGWVDRKLILLDTTSGRSTRAAVSVGDPDKSTHVSVTTPGLDTRVRDDIVSMTNEAAAVRAEAEFQLTREPGREGESVATVAWIGYDTPQVKKVFGEGEYADAAAGVADVGSTDRAAEGGQALNRFYNGLEASHEGGERPHITAVGHSYGSLTTGMALQSGEHPVSDMVVYGSPGIAASTPQELGLDNGHAYVMRTDDDPIKWTQDGPQIAGRLNDAGIPVGGPVPFIAEAWTSSDNGGFGPDPAENPNFTQLETHDSKSYDGETRELPGASGHSEYPRTGPDGGSRVTTYNVAAIVAGLPDNVVAKR
ncbi:alpha/beta hydrolase [Nocardia sp. NPDC059177]|uniref:alpha/beta hydrolase n=1 Tax=Nocardia sp. NPDC059177 TaxID=3346759 RepID=UPI00369218A1